MTAARWGLLLFAAATLAGCEGASPVPVPVEGSPQQGPDDAWVTVVEFADFQCPYCARAAATVQQLVEAYPAADLRVVFKHLPLSFHARAMPAALAAQCAQEQGRFWPMYDLLYADSSLLSEAGLQSAAQQLGLDLTAWGACRTSEAAKQAVEKDVTLANELAIDATPTFFVNGYVIVGAEELETFEALVDREMAKVKASGIDRAEYYDRVVLGK